MCLMLNVKLQSLAALHTDGRGDGCKYCDDKIDDLLDGFFSHGLMIYKNLIQLKMFITREIS